MLAELVAAGSLPAVDERLPADVEVVTPFESVGEYGGTWHDATSDPNMSNIKMIMYDPPIRWKDDYDGYEPGLAKSYEWSEDGTTFTLHFREGVKWSDGEPFTMEDLKFWWTDLAVNEDYRVIQVPWWGFKSDGSLADVAFPDDYTMTITWDTPQWVAPYILAQGFWEWEPLMKPRHYLEQFHPTYTPDAKWEDLEAKSKWWENPDHPTLFAWHLETHTPGERWIFVRNPYYWKVDTEGNQLPYIDRLDVELVQDPEVRLLNLSQGKYDASFREATDDPRNLSFLAEQADANGYHLVDGWMNGAGGWPSWLINQDYIGPGDDPELDQEIRMTLRDKRFRKALSVAIDRERLIDVVWEGIGTPQQATISPQAWHFQSEAGQQVFQEWQQSDAEFDQAKANAWLDEVGMVDTDGDGMRELPSGKPFELILDVGDWGGQVVPVESAELLKEFYAAVGINVLINNLMNQPDWNLRGNEGLYMMRNCHISEVDLWTYPDWVFPLRGGGEGTRAFPQQGKWRQTGGKEGEEPLPGSPAALLQALYDKGLAEPDEQKRHEIVWEAIRIHIEEGPFTLGAAGDQPMPVVLKNNFHNVPPTGVLGPWAPGSPGNKHPEQFYISAQ
jgi:peptide/nickel transport system substrate-binding protein